MPETQPTIESLQQAVKALQEQVRLIQASLAKAGLAVIEEGVVGVYEGDFMVTAEGQRFQVPANYASKTMLVSGDHLRMVEAADGAQAKFKQIVKVERLKAEGLLAKKDGKYEVLTDQGSFKVLAAAVKHYEGQPGDRVMIQYPKQHVRGSWAAIEKLISSTQVLPTISPVNGEGGSIALPTTNMVQIKHAPASSQSTPAPKAASEPMMASEANTPAKAAAEAKPAANQPKKDRQAARSTENRSSNQEASTVKSSASKSKSKSRSKAKTKAGNGPAKSTAPSKEVATPQPAKPVERSLPLDKGEIAPMAEFDEDELM